jgi:hypothetical protein
MLREGGGDEANAEASLMVVIRVRVTEASLMVVMGWTGKRMGAWCGCWCCGWTTAYRKCQHVCMTNTINANADRPSHTDTHT